MDPQSPCPTAIHSQAYGLILNLTHETTVFRKTPDQVSLGLADSITTRVPRMMG